jgi:hypothetical protein
VSHPEIQALSGTLIESFSSLAYAVALHPGHHHRIVLHQSDHPLFLNSHFRELGAGRGNWGQEVGTGGRKRELGAGGRKWEPGARKRESISGTAAGESDGQNYQPYRRRGGFRERMGNAR